MALAFETHVCFCLPLVMASSFAFLASYPHGFLRMEVNGDRLRCVLPKEPYLIEKLLAAGLPHVWPPDYSGAGNLSLCALFALKPGDEYRTLNRWSQDARTMWRYYHVPEDGFSATIQLVCPSLGRRQLLMAHQRGGTHTAHCLASTP